MAAFVGGGIAFFDHGQRGRRTAKSPRAASDAIDAEGDVEERAEQWNQHDDSDPGDGRSGVALVQQRVRGGRDRDEHGTHAGDVRPELVQPIDECGHLSPLPRHMTNSKRHGLLRPYANRFRCVIGAIVRHCRS